MLSWQTIPFTTFITYIILPLSDNHTKSFTSKQQTYPHKPWLHTVNFFLLRITVLDNLIIPKGPLSFTIYIPSFESLRLPFDYSLHQDIWKRRLVFLSQGAHLPLTKILKYTICFSLVYCPCTISFPNLNQ